MKRLKWKLGSVYLEIVLILMQDMCTVGDEPTLAHPMVLLGKGAQVEAWLGLFGDRAILDTR